MRVIAWLALAMVASPLVAQEATQGKTAQAVFEELEAEFVKARTEYIAQAQEKGEKIDIKVVAEPFYSRFDEAAKRYAGTDDAVPFLAWIVMNFTDDKTRVNAVVDEILAHHIASAQLEPLAGGMSSLSGVIGEERAAELADAIMAQGHPEVKATMLFFRGYYATMDRNASEEAKASATDDLRRAAELGGRYGGMAEGMLFEREKLQLGMEAPDIVAKDLDGVEFKLSDYRGKVVVIDFWGDW